MSPLGVPQEVPAMKPPKRSPISLPNWLSATLGAQDERGKWWIHGETLILQDGVGRNASYFAQRFDRSGGCSWEREFASEGEVKRFVRAELKADAS